MKLKLAFAFALISATFSAQADWSFQPKLGLVETDYKLTLNKTLEGSGHISGIGLGLSVVHSSGFFIDLDNSLGDDPIDGFYDDYASYSTNETTASRNDTSISIGHSEAGFSLFAGYKITETSIGCDECVHDPNNLSNDFSFTTTGFFVGAAKTFAINKSHFINASFALGNMEGDYRPEDSQANTSSNNGNAFGYSFTGSYIYRISNTWNISAGLKNQSYKYSEMGNNASFDVDSAEESFTTFFLRAGYRI